jgi:hypothetical protein
MTPYVADVTGLLGLLMTFFGAAISARAAILTPYQAAETGVSRIAGKDWGDNLHQPMVRNLLAASRAAQIGLGLIAIGSAIQALPIVLRLAYG